MSFNCKALAQHLFDSARTLLQELQVQAQAPLYAAAFHASYRKEDEVLSLPSLAANSQQTLDEDFPDEENQSFSSLITVAQLQPMTPSLSCCSGCN